MKKKHKRYISDHRHRSTPQAIAAHLGIDESEVSDFLKKFPEGKKYPAEQALQPKPLIETVASKSKILLFGIFCLALFVRLIYLRQVSQSPLFDSFVLDSSYYTECASKILKGDFFDPASTYGSPLYPFFMAGTAALFGGKFFAVRLLQVLLDSLISVLLYLICLKVFKNKVMSLAAALVYSLYGLAIFFTGFFLDVTLIAFLYSALLWVILIANKKGKPLLWMAAGVLLGLCLATKTNILLFLPFLVFWLWWDNSENSGKRKIVKDLSFVVLGALIVLLLFAARNQKIEGRFSPFPTHGGLNFYIGNHEGATGGYTHLESISDTPIDQINDSIRLAERNSGKKLSSSEASAYWFNRGLEFAKRSPAGFWGLMAKKFALFWNREETASNANYYFYKKYIPILNWPFFNFGVIAPFALLGIFLSFTKKPSETSLLIYFVLSYCASVILLFVTDRYRFPCVPVLVIFSVYAAVRLIELRRLSKTPRFLASIGVLVAAFLFVHQNASATRSEEQFFVSYNNLGADYLEKGETDKAMELFQKAIQEKPGYAPAYYNLAKAYNQKGMTDQAVENYKKAIEADPHNPYAYYNLGGVYKKIGLRSEAIAQYKKALEADPSYDSARARLEELQS